MRNRIFIMVIGVATPDGNFVNFEKEMEDRGKRQQKPEPLKKAKLLETIRKNMKDEGISEIYITDATRKLAKEWMIDMSPEMYYIFDDGSIWRP